MAKNKTEYVCTECGANYSKWQGQCQQCHSWDCIKEFRVAKTPAVSSHHQQHLGFSGTSSSVQYLHEVELTETLRFSTGISEFDRVLGGGLVAGGTILLGGSPGAGKSTILLQSLSYLSQNMATLYVSGEESLQQIAARAKRLGVQAKNLKMLAETSVSNICHIALQEHPKVIVIDSIQVMYLEHVDNTPGGVTQVRECAAYLTRFAKQHHIVLFFIGHVTKDQSIAGPMTLNHIIDTQVMLSSTDDARYRIMRTNKNRFGPVNELGIFAMTETGLKEVKNPSAIFLSHTEEATPGSIISVLWEGTRPLLVEIQALVVDSQLGNPRRVTLGIDHNRLAMLLAILSRHGGIFTHDQDIFLNVVGGVKVSETSADMAVLLAILSSLNNKIVPHHTFAFGEVGLSGEIRPVANGQDRIHEAAKHGFKQAIVPKANIPKHTPKGLKIIAVSRLQEALDSL